jgi:hypothetical protein
LEFDNAEACWFEPVKKRNFGGAENALLEKSNLQQSVQETVQLWRVGKLVRSINFEKNGELHKKDGLLTSIKVFSSSPNI